MNAPLRINEALLITGRAFQPFECVAWEGNGELSITVIDRTSVRPLNRKQINRSAYSDPAQLASFLTECRNELSQKGYQLARWDMPE
jgi:hypothetical protein